ncbi:MAG: hypothetical protein JJT78_01265 [Leptospira sp.]|nr:hypothetical protein [Leptospira sp.]
MVKEKTETIKKKCGEFYSLAMGETRDNSRRFLFIYLSWMVFLLFLSFSFLAEKNPFSLLLPFQIFELPLDDPRQERKVYVSDGEENVYSSTRLVFVTGDIISDIRELVEEIGRPPHFSKPAEEGDNFFGAKLKKLPNLSISLVTIWERKEKKTIILDFSSQEIIRELAKYRFAKKSIEEDEDEDIDLDIENYYSPPQNFIDSKTLAEMDKKKTLILGLTLNAIRRTILENNPDYEKVHFHLDGKRGVGQGILSAFSEE